MLKIVLWKTTFKAKSVESQAHGCLEYLYQKRGHKQKHRYRQHGVLKKFRFYDAVGKLIGINIDTKVIFDKAMIFRIKLL